MVIPAGEATVGEDYWDISISDMKVENRNDIQLFFEGNLYVAEDKFETNLEVIISS